MVLPWSHKCLPSDSGVLRVPVSVDGGTFLVRDRRQTRRTRPHLPVRTSSESGLYSPGILPVPLNRRRRDFIQYDPPVVHLRTVVADDDPPSSGVWWEWSGRLGVWGYTSPPSRKEGPYFPRADPVGEVESGTTGEAGIEVPNPGPPENKIQFSVILPYSSIRVRP